MTVAGLTVAAVAVAGSAGRWMSGLVTAAPVPGGPVPASPTSVAARIAAAASDPLGPSEIDADDIRDLACEATASASVCSPPELPEPRPRPSVAPDGGAGGGALGQLLVIVLVIALVAVLVWLLWQYLRTPGRDRSEDEPDDLDADEELDTTARLIDESRPPDRWRRAAAEHRERGEYRDSIRCEYRALVGDLARAGYVDEIPGRTSGEEREQIASIASPTSDVPGRFDDAADRFDRAWFDDAVVTADDDQRFTTAAGAVRFGLRVGPEAATR